MRLHLRYLALLLCCLAGCERGSDWQQKYAGCKTLASVMAAQPSAFIKPPDCERIPQLCAGSPQSAECKKELQKYYRK